MLNERPEGKDKFGYVLIGLLVAFVIILVTSAVIWNSNHPEKVQENFEKIDTQQAEEKKGAKLGPYTIQLKDKKVVDCVGGALYTFDFLLCLKAEDSYDVPLNGGESFRRVPVSSGSTLRPALPASDLRPLHRRLDSPPVRRRA